MAVDERGRNLGVRTTTATTTQAHPEFIRWAEGFEGERTWAVKDRRNLSRRLEADLLRAGERIVRMPPKLMPHARDAARAWGTSAPIDALAVARVALREEDLPAAHLDQAARELRLLTDHRDHLVAERTRLINRLRWYLHEINPERDPPAPQARSTIKHVTRIAGRLEAMSDVVAEIAAEITERIRGLTERTRALAAQITDQVTPIAPALMAIHGVAALAAAKLIAETAGIASRAWATAS